MLTKNYQLENFHINYPIHTIDIKTKILFIDIETTGLSPINSSIYMIGIAYYEGHTWCVTQYFAETLQEEVNILSTFQETLKKYETVIHFNGNRFDLPFLEKRCSFYNISLDFSKIKGIDLFKRATKLRNILLLPNYTQKTIEQFLGIERKDMYSGKELIKTYETYIISPNDSILNIMYQHNLDDLKGLLYILPILSYSELIDESIKIKKVQMQTTKDVHGDSTYELLLTLETAVSIPKPISCNKNSCFLTASQNLVMLMVPVIQGEMKYFYKNYKDYYYIEELDNAFHKSVSKFADHTLLKQASAKNCYTRKASIFLQQFEQLITPVYKSDFSSKDFYFEITDEIRTNREVFHNYALHVIRMMI